MSAPVFNVIVWPILMLSPQLNYLLSVVMLVDVKVLPCPLLANRAQFSALSQIMPPFLLTL